jgi:hypothetical protein
MIATVTAFSLFTAYQFLSFNELVSDPESKMRPYPSSVYRRIFGYMMEMITTRFSLLTAYQILIAVKETSELSCLTIRMFQISVIIVHFVYSFREY